MGATHLPAEAWPSFWDQPVARAWGRTPRELLCILLGLGLAALEALSGNLNHGANALFIVGGTGSGKDVDRALDALRAARGAIVRVGVGGGRYQVGELAGGALAPLADADAETGPTHPVLRLIDERDQVAERAHSLGVISNSAPTRVEWDAYVAACRNGGLPAPRVGDVNAVRAALDRVFRVGEQVGFGTFANNPRGGRSPPPRERGRSPPREPLDARRNRHSPPREFGRAPAPRGRRDDGPRSRSPPPRDRGPGPGAIPEFDHRGAAAARERDSGWDRRGGGRGGDPAAMAPFDRPPRRDGSREYRRRHRQQPGAPLRLLPSRGV